MTAVKLSQCSIKSVYQICYRWTGNLKDIMKMIKYKYSMESSKYFESTDDEVIGKTDSLIEVKQEGAVIDLEKRVGITLQDTELGFSGKIIMDDNNIGDFLIRKIDSERAYIYDIQIGYDENAPRNRGYGFEAYKKIIDEMKKRGIRLMSTDFSISYTSISPQALRVWEKLFLAGYAQKVGEVEAKILDRFGKTGDEIRVIPKYESII